MTNPPRTIDLRLYRDVLLARKLWIIVPVILGAVLAMLYTYAQPARYTAHAAVRVNPLVSPLLPGTSKASQPDMPTEQQTAGSAQVAALARPSLRAGASAGTLLHGLQVQAGNGNILQFQYTSASPRQAARYANAFAQAYVAYRSRSIATPLDRLIRKRQRSIASLRHELANPPLTAAQTTLSQLASRLSSEQADLLQIQDSRQLISGGAVIGSAKPPASPSSPKSARGLAIGVVAGLVAGVCLALLAEGLDGRLRSPAELEASVRAPVIGVIPRPCKRRGAPPRLITGRCLGSEAFRASATTLHYLAARNGLRAVMLTSPLPGSGTTTATASLGAALAQAGQRVILVSADLRSPELHRCFGLSNKAGLSTALLEGRDVTTLLQGALPGLDVLASGPKPSDPAGVLAGPAVAEILTSLRGLDPDLILVDTPSLLPDADALALACRVDGAVVVWNAGSRRAAALTEARRSLTTAGANIVGGIYTCRPGRRAGYLADREYPGTASEAAADSFPAALREPAPQPGRELARARLSGTGDDQGPGPR